MTDNVLPAGLLEDDDEDNVMTFDANDSDGELDDMLNAIGSDSSDTSTPPKDTPADTSTPPPADPIEWEEPPTPIADWQNLAKQNNIPASSEAEFRDNLSVRQYVQDQFGRDAETQQLYHLADEATPARARISRYVAEKIREPYESPTDPDVLSRVEGALTDYYDDEGQLTPKGKKLDEHLKAEYGNQVSKRVEAWAEAGQTHLSNNKLFVNALQTELSTVEGLTPEQQREAYRYIRKGNLDRVVDGVDENGKRLSPQQAAKAQAEVALWSNADTRKILIEKREKAAYEKGQSEALKKNL